MAYLVIIVYIISAVIVISSLLATTICAKRVLKYKEKIKELERLLDTGNQRISKMGYLIEKELGIRYCNQCWKEMKIDLEEYEPASMQEYDKQRLCVDCYNNIYGIVIGTGTGI